MTRGRRARKLAASVALALAACTPVGMPPTSAPPPRPAPARAPEPVQPPATAPEPDPVAPRASRAAVPPVRSFDETRGLWVVRSSMTSEAEVRRMVEEAADAGFNTLIVQVRGRGDAFYSSALEPRAETMMGPADFDPLALAVAEGHRRGLAVHAWVNTHLVWGPTARPQSPLHLVNANPEWLAVPRQLARELYDVDPHDPRFYEALRRYAADRPETVEGIYTSPSHPEVRARVLNVWMDLLTRYELDGIHFDYIRFPSQDFDYSRGGLERFRGWLDGRLPPWELARLDSAAVYDPRAYATGRPAEWDEFRREQITSLVREIYTAVKAYRPEVVVSAAVVPDSETAFSRRFQDWRGWLREGILDVAVPMAYTPDDDTFRRLVRSARGAAGSPDRIWAGIGAYMNTVDGTMDKIDLARAEGAGGVVLFSYDWAVAQPARGGEPYLDEVGRERFGS